jgi:hypothetical protein
MIGARPVIGVQIAGGTAASMRRRSSAAGDATGPGEGHHRRVGTADEGVRPVAVAMGLASSLTRVSMTLTARAATLLSPVTRLALSPPEMPFLPARLQPRRRLESLARRGAGDATALRSLLSRVLDRFVPLVAEQLVRRLAVTSMVTRYVDLDEVIAAVDLDAAAMRLDIDAVVRRADVDAVVRRADLEAVLRRVDVDAMVRRVDVEAVLDRVDLTGVVLERVDLDALLQAVLDRLDLAALAADVMEAVDLPEIIRASTGSVASETVRGARMQGIAADEAIGRLRSRLRSRRAEPPTREPPTRGLPAQGAPSS